jgi:prepilin-type N-terminal cleavage/methylation domain-containing protein
MRRAVTLIELLITMTIMAIIAAAILGVAAQAIEGSREKKTTSIIAKINLLISERLADYETRRVELSQRVMDSVNSFPDPKIRGRALADMRLLGMRELMKMEMPDRWTDVSNPPQVLARRPGPSAAYYTRWQGVQPSPLYQGAECLYMTAMRHTGDGEAPGMFNADQIGDVDKDGCNEILDGWGQPISWLRWPVGYAPSPLMTGNDEADHDPLDFYVRDVPKAQRLPNHFPRPNNPQYPAAVLAALASMENRDGGAFRIVPLIWSHGPDGEQMVNSGVDNVVYDLDPYDVAEADSGDPMPIGFVRPERVKDDVGSHLIEY